MEDHKYQPIDIEDNSATEISNKLSYAGKKWFFSKNGDYFLIGTKVGSHPVYIAEIKNGYALFDNKKQLNHAKLIAAVPEMYDILCDFHEGINFFTRQDRLKELMQILEKE